MALQTVALPGEIPFHLPFLGLVTCPLQQGEPGRPGPGPGPRPSGLGTQPSADCMPGWPGSAATPNGIGCRT